MAEVVVVVVVVVVVLCKLVLFHFIFPWWNKVLWAQKV